MRCLTVLLAASTASALQPHALKKPWRALGKAVAPALLGAGLASSIAAPPANAAALADAVAAANAEAKI